MSFHLVTTDHLSDRLWFKDTQDFVVAMNIVAVLSLRMNVSILAFILMSNHVHFVLAEDKAKALKFITEFKRLFSWYLTNKYGKREQLRRNDVDIRELSAYDESLERAIAYVQMNCVAAGLCLSPTDYRWGSGNCFFRASTLNGTPVRTLSRRKIRALTHSTEVIPEDWLFSQEGYILPDCYIARDFVQSLFRKPQRMLYFLEHSSKAAKRLSLSEQDIPSFKDQTIVAAIPDLCRALFRKNSFKELNPTEQTELLRQLRRRFSSNINQLCRITGLEYADAAKLLDSI